MRHMFGVFGKAGRVNSIAFVSKVWASLSLSLSLFPLQAAVDCDVKALYGLNKVEAVGNVRRLTEFNMKLIDALQKIMVDQDRG